MIPLDVRKSLWAWYYGLRAFQHCKACCDHIIQEKMTDDHPLYYSLNVAAHISYGKPFRTAHGMERLSETIIPAKYAEAHSQVLKFRDKLYAHTDTVGNAWKSGRSVDVMFCLQRNGQHWTRGFKLLEVTVRPIGFERFSDLCEVLTEKANYHMLKALKRYDKDFPTAAEDYRIGITPTDLPFTKV